MPSDIFSLGLTSPVNCSCTVSPGLTSAFSDASVTKDEQKQLDAEHDILFYLGNEGASYSFKPEDGCTVTVAQSSCAAASAAILSSSASAIPHKPMRYLPPTSCSFVTGRAALRNCLC